jgi:hypothetical protein
MSFFRLDDGFSMRMIIFSGKDYFLNQMIPRRRQDKRQQDD